MNIFFVFQAVEYLKKRTPARAAMMIAAVWLMSALICIPPLLGWRAKREIEEFPKCKVTPETIFHYINLSFCFNLPYSTDITKWQQQNMLLLEGKLILTMHKVSMLIYFIFHVHELHTRLYKKSRMYTYYNTLVFYVADENFRNTTIFGE